MRFNPLKFFNFKFPEVEEPGYDESGKMNLPSWKHRRRLIYASYVLGAAMIIFGAFVYLSDTQVASQLIVGGVSLISIILTAYTAFATLDDRFHYREYGREFRYGAPELPTDEEGQEYNPDGEPLK